jgi:L-lysine 2,3-aminomutase
MERINNMAKEFEYPEWAQYLTKAVINITDDCNLACRYCFVE